MVSAGSGNSCSDRSYANLEQLLSDGSDDTGHGMQRELQRLRVKAPTVAAVALKHQMLVYIEKAGMISPPFDVPLEIKETLFDRQLRGLGVLDEEQRWDQQQLQQLGPVGRQTAGSVQLRDVTVQKRQSA